MVSRPSRSFGMGRGTLGEVQNGSGTHENVWDRSGILGEVRDGLEYPHTGLGRVEGPSERSGTGRGTLGEVRDGLE